MNELRKALDTFALQNAEGKVSDDLFGKGLRCLQDKV